MRCLALAQAWQDSGGHSFFVIVGEEPGVENWLKAEGMEIIYLSVEPGRTEDASQTVKLAQQKAAAWVMVDGYHFGSQYQRHIKEGGLSLLFVDDNGNHDRYYADIVLNQNLCAHKKLYARGEPYTRLLLGPSYVLLRREFLTWGGGKCETPQVGRNVLVTLGGSDPDNITRKVIHALEGVDIPGLEVKILVGPANPNIESLKEAVLSARSSTGIVEHVTNMPELLNWADIVIIAAGGTLWENLFVGGATLSFARNPVQDEVISELERQSIVKHLGYPDEIDRAILASSIREIALSRAKREHMGALGRSLIDGRGAARVLQAVAEH
jgi:UDP-2,4-diacetamido-2,4,6-trideoxy-beta-L-altropyranose hydrolase